MKILSIINNKGGVAKTTTAVNLAACFAIDGHKTLLIDLDSQANASQALGLFSFDHGVPDLFENDKTTLKSVVNPTAIDFLSIVPSDLSLSQIEWYLLKNFKPKNVEILRDKLKAEKLDFEYVVIDCPPSLGLFNLNALMASDRVIIPVALDPYAILGTKYLFSVIDDMRMNGNKTLKVLGIARTIWNNQQVLGREITANLEQDYPGKVFKSVITNTVRIKESVIAKTPIVLHEPSSPGSQQYRALHNEVLARW